MTALQLPGLTKYDGETWYLENPSFDVGEGEVFGALDPNDADRISIIRILMCSQFQPKGDATDLDHDIHNNHNQIGVEQKGDYLSNDLALNEDATSRCFLEAWDDRPHRKNWATCSHQATERSVVRIAQTNMKYMRQNT